MSAGLLHALRRPTSQKRASRRPRMLTVAVAALLTTLVGFAPARMAFAEQVLELPQPTAPSVSSSVPTDEGATVEKSAPREVAPLPSGLGSIDDYENQDSSPRSSRYAAGYPAGYAANGVGASGGTRIDHRGQPTQLQNEVMLGAVVLGVLAMELSHSHHHR